MRQPTDTLAEAAYVETLTRTGILLTTFSDLGVLPEITGALERAGIVDPFPIQEMALPVALMGTDLIGQARTGTGKTLAFGIPVLQRTVSPRDPDYADLAAPDRPQALVVAPTRELALQVSGDLRVAGADRGSRVLTVYGGVPYEPQLDALGSGVDVVVGTPGRLLDLVQRRALDLSTVKVLVLDEADEMLDLGFLPDVERLLARTPETRQTMLFSATMPGAVVTLARVHMRHPVNIRAESGTESQIVPATAQFIYQVHDLDKPELVGRILQAEDSGLTIVFTRTKRQAQRVADDLAERGFPSSPLHGDMPQVAREKALRSFRDGGLKVLVATDVAARGIDVEGVTHVVNYSCPEDEKIYLHRIGRTGRAGASGVAITFVDWPDVTRWKAINAALDLPFDEPPETYSTSPAFYHDLGIPPGTRGRLTGQGSPGASRSSGAEPGQGRKRAAGAGVKRERTRTRAGQLAGGRSVAAAEPPAVPAGGNETRATGDAAASRRRGRNRRRTRGNKPASA